LAGAAMIYPANPLPFIASDAAVGFWSLFSYRKRTSLRGNERKCQKHHNRAFNNKTKLNTLSFEGQKKQKPFFSLRQLAHTHHTQKPKALGLRFTKGKTMPFPNAQCPLSPFV
jgi:hypothetical protein